MKKTGIRGWLLVYCIGPLGLGTLMLLLQVQSSQGSGTFVGLLFLNLYLLYITIFNRTSTSRTVNIWANGFFSGIVLIEGLSTGNIEGVGAALGASIWFFYWLRSKRVKLTYGE